VTGWELVSQTSASTSADKSISVDCPGTKTLLGGGGLTNNADAYLYASYPTDSNTWTVSAGEDTNLAASWTVTAWVVCASL
jgi:hypothetical protein